MGEYETAGGPGAKLGGGCALPRNGPKTATAARGPKKQTFNLCPHFRQIVLTDYQNCLTIEHRSNVVNVDPAI